MIVLANGGLDASFDPFSYYNAIQTAQQSLNRAV